MDIVKSKNNFNVFCVTSTPSFSPQLKQNVLRLQGLRFRTD